MISAGIMGQFTKKLEEMGAQMEGSVKALKGAFPDAVELHGDIPLKQRLANVQKFNSGQAKMIICTQATADTGLSLHDTIGTHPRSQINVTLPWSGMAMKQLSGRSHRLGSKSDTNMHWIFAKVPDEQHRAAIMALKLKILGASAKGIDVDTSDEAYKKMMEFIYKGDIDDPMAKLIKSLFDDSLHVILVEDLIKGRKLPRDYIRTVRGKAQHVVEGNSKKVYTNDRSALVKEFFAKYGDTDKTRDRILHTITTNETYGARRNMVREYAPHLYPDLSRDEATKKALARARALGIIAKSLSFLSFEANCPLLVRLLADLMGEGFPQGLS